MAQTPHNVAIDVNHRSYPQFKYEATCSCRWQAKVQTENDAKEVGDRHIKANGGVGTLLVKDFIAPSFDPSKGNEVKVHAGQPGTSQPASVHPPATATIEKEKPKFAPSAVKPAAELHKEAAASGSGNPAKKFS